MASGAADPADPSRPRQGAPGRSLLQERREDASASPPPSGDGSGAQTPTADSDPQPPLRYIQGQMLHTGPSKEKWFLGAVNFTNVKVQSLFNASEVEVSYDLCNQNVFPWTPPPRRAADDCDGFWIPFLGTLLSLPDWQPKLRKLRREIPRHQGRLDVYIEGMKIQAKNGTVDSKELEEAWTFGAKSLQEVRDFAESLLKDICALQNRETADAHYFAGEVWTKKILEVVDTGMKLCEKAKRLLQRASDGHDSLRKLQELNAIMLGLKEDADRSELEAESIAAESFQACGVLGARRYAAGQKLSVLLDGDWLDVEVAEVGAQLLGAGRHLVSAGGERRRVALHPLNHAPLQIARQAFDAIFEDMKQRLVKRHTLVPDRLTGRKFPLLGMCVPLDATSQELAAGGVRDSSSLHDWLQATMIRRRVCKHLRHPLVILVTALPATGKTTLMHQLMLMALHHETNSLVPVYIKACDLQARLMERPDAFDASWNWIDAYFSVECHRETYLFYRQLLMSRRALLLIDGLDEGGRRRHDLEHHIATVLGPQGHPVLATLRPFEIDHYLFKDAHHVAIAPFDDAQQRATIEHRLESAESVQPVMDYVQRMMPDDPDSSRSLIANPVMLTMITSVYSLRSGVGMPTSKIDQYELAVRLMLDQGEIWEDVHVLVRNLFLKVHMQERRIITLADVFQVGQALRTNGSTVDSLVQSINDDEMPLFTVLQSEPLEFQAVHLTYQEYLAAQALRLSQLPDDLLIPPWVWSPWFANFSSFGCNMGTLIGLGRRAAISLNKELNLTDHRLADFGCQSLAASACAGVMLGIQVLKLGSNNITDAGCQLLSDAAAVGAFPQLQVLQMYRNSIGCVGCKWLAGVANSGALPYLHTLDMHMNAVGDVGCHVLGAIPQLRKLDLRWNPGMSVTIMRDLREDCEAKGTELILEPPH